MDGNRGLYGRMPSNRWRQFAVRSNALQGVGETIASVIENRRRAAAFERLRGRLEMQQAQPAGGDPSKDAGSIGGVTGTAETAIPRTAEGLSILDLIDLGETSGLTPVQAYAGASAAMRPQTASLSRGGKLVNVGTGKTIAENPYEAATQREWPVISRKAVPGGIHVQWGDPNTGTVYDEKILRHADPDAGGAGAGEDEGRVPDTLVRWAEGRRAEIQQRIAEIRQEMEELKTPPSLSDITKPVYTERQRETSHRALFDEAVELNNELARIGTSYLDSEWQYEAPEYTPLYAEPRDVAPPDKTLRKKWEKEKETTTPQTAGAPGAAVAPGLQAGAQGGQLREVEFNGVKYWIDENGTVYRRSQE